MAAAASVAASPSTLANVTMPPRPQTHAQLVTPVIFSGQGNNLYPFCDPSAAAAAAPITPETAAAAASSSSASAAAHVAASTPASAAFPSPSPSPLPKALLPLANRPLVSFTLQWIFSAGLRRAILFAAKAEHAAIARALSRVHLVSPPAAAALPHQAATPTTAPIVVLDGLTGNNLSQRAARGVVGAVSASSSSPADTTATDAKLAQPNHAFSLELFPLGPWDEIGHLPHDARAPPTAGGAAPNVAASAASAAFRHTLQPGTAELVAWIESMGVLQTDALVLPSDLFFPSYPLVELLTSHLAHAHASAPASTHVGGRGRAHDDDDGGEPASLTALLYERGAGEGTGKEREKEATPRLLVAHASEPMTTPLASSVSAVSPSTTTTATRGSSSLHALLLVVDPGSSSRGSTLTDDEVRLRRQLLVAQPRTVLRTDLGDAHVYVVRGGLVSALLGARPELTSLREHVVPLLAKLGWQRGLADKVARAGAGKGRVEGRRGERSGERDASDDEERGGAAGAVRAAAAGQRPSAWLRAEAWRRSSSSYAPTTYARGEAPGAIPAARDADADAGDATAALLKRVRCLAVVCKLGGGGGATGDSAPPPAKPHQASQPLVVGGGAAAAHDAEEAWFLARCNTLPAYLESSRWILRHALAAAAATTTTHHSRRATIAAASAWFALPVAASSSSSPAAAAAAGESAPPSVSDSAQLSSDTLVGEGSRVGERAVVKRSVLGRGVVVARNARIVGCVVMEGARVGEGAKLEGTLLGAHCDVGERANLRDCDVAAGVRVGAGTSAKHEKMVLEEEEDEEEDEDEDEDEVGE